MKTRTFDPTPLENKMIRIQNFLYSAEKFNCVTEELYFSGKYVGLEYDGSLMFEKQHGYKQAVIPQSIAKPLIRKGACIDFNKTPESDEYSMIIWTLFEPHERSVDENIGHYIRRLFPCNDDRLNEIIGLLRNMKDKYNLDMTLCELWNQEFTFLRTRGKLSIDCGITWPLELYPKKQ